MFTMSLILNPFWHLVIKKGTTLQSSFITTNFPMVVDATSWNSIESTVIRQII
jgi:hypothetical protein